MNSKTGTTPSLDAGTPPLFRESQRFRYWIFYVPIAVVVVIIWYQFGQQVIMGNPQGSDPVPNWVAWLLTIVFGLGFPIFALVVRLTTQVRPGVLSVRLVPFRTKRFPVSEIASAEVRQYSALREFGGWGIRVGREGKAYNAWGDQGVQLVLTDGNRVLIGTQRPEELLAALRLAGVRGGPET